MPFLLRAEAGQYVQLQTRIDYASSDNFLIAVEANPLQNINFWRPIGGNDFAASSPRVLVFGGGRVRLTTDQGDREWLTGVDISTIDTLEFSRNSGQLDLLINGNLIGGGFSGNTDTISGFRIFNANFGSTSATTVDYKSILFERNGIVIHNYNKQVISGSNDTVFPDTVGGNDGTLVNFPTDNSQWVFFDDGGGTIAPTGVPSEESFGSPSVVLQLQSISPTGISSQEALGSPILDVGSVLIQPQGVGSEEAIGSATVALLSQFISVNAIPTGEMFGQPLVLGGDSIVIPVDDRQTWYKVAEYLRTLGFVGSTNDVVVAWLRSEGIDAQWNDGLMIYWESLGLPNQFADKRAAWVRGDA